MLTDAYQRVHEELVITTAVAADGIRPDGSFGQVSLHPMSNWHRNTKPPFNSMLASFTTETTV
jgi:hypothetical protein